EVSTTEYARVRRPGFTLAELGIRRQRALALSQEALSFYRLTRDDAGQYLGAAITWLDSVDLATRDPTVLKTDAVTRPKWMSAADPALREIGRLINKAGEVHARNGHKLPKERQEDIRAAASGISALYRAGVSILNREIERSTK